LLFEELHASIGDLTVVNTISLVTLFYRLCSSKTAFPTVKSPNDTHNISNTILLDDFLLKKYFVLT
jgi:hypothetical protein